MHRTEGANFSNATGVNLFQDGFLNGTNLEQNWLNAIQEEMAYVIEQAGLVLKTASTETDQQLMSAINVFVAGGTVSDAAKLGGQLPAYYLSGANVTGTVPLASEADTLDSQHGAYYLDAGNLNAGTIALARIPTTLTGKDADTVDTFHAATPTGANQVLVLDGSGHAIPNTSTQALGDTSNYWAGVYSKYIACFNEDLFNAEVAATGSELGFFKSRNALTSDDDDTLGQILFYGTDTGNTARNTSGIYSIQEGAAASPYIPAKLLFFTGTAGSAPVERLKIDLDGKIITGIESTYAFLDSGGFCIGHGSNDGKALVIHNGDISHTMTDVADANTYFDIKKTHSTNGGVSLEGYSDLTTFEAITLVGTTPSADTTTSSSSNMPTKIDSYIQSGNARGAVGAGGNLFGVANAGTNVLLVKDSGNTYIGGGLYVGGDWAPAENEIASAANADVVSARALALRSTEVWIITSSEGNVYRGLWRVTVTRAGTGIGGNVDEVEDTYGATVTIADNADGTYDINVVNNHGSLAQLFIPKLQDTFAYIE